MPAYVNSAKEGPLMKLPLPMPFLHRGEHAGETGVSMTAVLGFLTPFFLLLVTGVITYFVIRAAV